MARVAGRTASTSVRHRCSVARRTTIEKFGRAILDDASDIVWVPTLKHEQITGHYNALERGDQPRVLHRDVVDQLDFAAQRAAGLDALRRFGVLK